MSSGQVLAGLSGSVREVAARFGCKEVRPDPEWERSFAAALRDGQAAQNLAELWSRFREGETAFDALMRRVLCRAMCKGVGHDFQAGPGVVLTHPETMEFGDCVSIGAQAIIQGRFDGSCRIGSHVWIGPQAFLDARNLIIEDYVGWGPGAKALGSTHKAEPVEVPIITTNLMISPVVIGYGADIGVNAVVLPGRRVGAHAIIGAGAVVTKDVPDYAVAAGVPARVLRSRLPEPASRTD